MASHVEEAVRARIQAAKRRTENVLRQRAELAAARRAGLAKRHAAKLANLRGADDNAGVTETVTTATPHNGAADIGGPPTTAGNRGDTPTVDEAKGTQIVGTPDQASRSDMSTTDEAHL